jgi:hypothetical protein
MKTRNLTPFDVLFYSALTKDDERIHVVAMRTDFRLIPVDETKESHNFRAVVIDKNPPALCVEDQYWDNTAEVKRESDLAPYKPNVDVLVHGNAHAPTANTQGAFTVGIRVTRARHENAVAAADTRHDLLSKTLQISGGGFFKKKQKDMQLSPDATDGGEQDERKSWLHEGFERITTLPMRYAYTYGGECKIPIPATKDERKRLLDSLDETVLLSEAQRSAHPESPSAPLAHTYEPLNPIGKGFVQNWFLKASQSAAVPIPQITYPDQSWSEEAIDAFLQACDSDDQKHPLRRPAGFGIIGRAWQPRIDKAGTYDDVWQESRHPYLPEDFEFAYWNGAPEDQQIDELPVDAHIELTHMNESGKLTFDLPGHRAFLMLRYESGAIIPRRMLIDTCIIDAEALTVSLVWRGFVSDEEAVRVLEARYETDIDAPLLVFERDPGQAHG